MELNMFFAILRRRWRVASFVTFVVICLVAFASQYISPKYQTMAILRVVTPLGGSSGETNYQTTFATRLTNTYTQIATSQQMMSELKKKLGIKALPDIQVSLIPDSEIIQIQVNSSSPALAAKAANTLAEMLILYQDNSTSGMDSKELSLLKDRVELSKAELLEYQQKHDELSQSYSETTSEMNILDRKIRLKEVAYQNLVTQYELMVADVAGLTGGANARQRDALANEIGVLEKELDSLHQQLRYLSVQNNNFLQQITLLRLYIQSAQSTYSNLLDQYDSVQLAHLRQGNAQKILNVSPAVEPSSPISSSRSFVLGLGLILGIVAGVIAAFVMDSLDPRVYSPEQIGRLTSVPVIGSISKYNQKHSTDLDPVVERDYWLLRARLQTLIQDGQIKTILLTSPNRAEGKSTVTYKLALGFAQSGSKVLIIDADMRMGKQHQFFDVTGEKSLQDYLIGEQESLNGLILKNVRAGIDLLPSLSPCDNALDLLQSPRIKTLLNSIDEYDVVLLDTPAFLAVPDALALSKIVDGVLVIVQSGHTTGGDIQTACQHLTSMGSRILGMVFNQIPVHARSNPYRPKWGQHRRQAREAAPSA